VRSYIGADQAIELIFQRFKGRTAYWNFGQLQWQRRLQRRQNSDQVLPIPR
jgi:hypothetical protein